jgi:dihydrofolate reductase
MRKIITTTFVTLDGVMQAPGDSKEDTSAGFKYGGWQMDWNEKDEIADNIINTLMSTPFDLLLGKRTYEMFASYWPKHPEIENVATPFNKARKYVVSHKPFDLTWDNSELITGEVVEKIKKLKNSDGPDLSVWGSSNLIQTLLKHNLIDRMQILTYPMTIGTGKKLFAEGTQPERFKPVDAKITTTGVLFATYEPAKPLKPGAK